jgi:hypothetical protein
MIEALAFSVVFPIFLVMLTERSGRVSRWLINRAVVKMPEPVRDEMREKLLGDSLHVEGPTWRIFHALGIFLNCWFPKPSPSPSSIIVAQLVSKLVFDVAFSRRMIPVWSTIFSVLLLCLIMLGFVLVPEWPTVFAIGAFGVLAYVLALTWQRVERVAKKRAGMVEPSESIRPPAPQDENDRQP